MLLPLPNVRLLSLQMKSVDGRKRAFAFRLIWKVEGPFQTAPFEDYVTDLVGEQDQPGCFYLTTAQGATCQMRFAKPFDEWLKPCSKTKRSKKSATTAHTIKRKRNKY